VPALRFFLSGLAVALMVVDHINKFVRTGRFNQYVCAGSASNFCLPLFTDLRAWRALRPWVRGVSPLATSGLWFWLAGGMAACLDEQAEVLWGSVAGQHHPCSAPLPLGISLVDRQRNLAITSSGAYLCLFFE
jgi:hypothetical protein